jgi:hypothetical protein
MVLEVISLIVLHIWLLVVDHLVAHPVDINVKNMLLVVHLVDLQVVAVVHLIIIMLVENHVSLFHAIFVLNK